MRTLVILETNGDIECRFCHSTEAEIEIEKLMEEAKKHYPQVEWESFYKSAAWVVFYKSKEAK